jgi:uncharacterized membrane-anchored protein YitT (DUF2179 family)
MKNLTRRTAVDFFWLLLGIVVMAVAFNVFLIPNRIAAGGISGLGIILLHLFNIPVGLTIFAANIPLLILSWRIIGPRFVINSLIGALALSLSIELLAFLRPLTADLLLASIYGGILVGIGVGIVFRAQGSSGGTALAARIINHYFGLTIGQSFLIVDFLIIALALIFLDAEVALYALLALFVSTKVTDLVQEGLSFSKAALIISDNTREIAARVLTELERGATEIPAQGAFTGEERRTLLVVLSQQEVSRLKAIVRSTDPKAFVVISNVSEVLGEGFRVR